MQMIMDHPWLIIPIALFIWLGPKVGKYIQNIISPPR